jgi:uncharacterized protein YdeI (YjbR/CyaY-like superfamily)
METIYLSTRNEWRTWLEKNHRSSKGVWLTYYKKHTGTMTIPYAEAVEEALCFGWIDSIVRRIDDQTYMQKFTPRNSGSKWSEENINRVTKLIAQNKMTPAGLERFREIEKHPEKILRKAPVPQKIILPADFIEEMNLNPAGCEKFLEFSVAYQHFCLRWIDSAKREPTRRKRIKEVLHLSAKGEKMGLK